MQISKQNETMLYYLRNQARGGGEMATKKATSAKRLGRGERTSAPSDMFSDSQGAS
jgi:hypothetical protein